MGRLANETAHAARYLLALCGAKDRTWDWRRLHPATDIQRAIDIDNNVTGLVDPDLKRFSIAEANC